jgi:hypothetical protein
MIQLEVIKHGTRYQKLNNPSLWYPIFYIQYSFCKTKDILILSIAAFNEPVLIGSKIS